MTKKDQPESGGEAQGHEGPSAAAVSAAAKHAQHALENAKDIVAQAHLDEVGARAAAAAANLYREGRERLAGNEDLSQATEQLSAAIRRNPLAAVGIAFSAGLLLALLTRG
ncbi:MAG TPA: hypothetical protein VGF57_05540 [Roseiarcus sp.]|jgi:ElaB/YqjD/DUF883 family membrane-anchored ribosome-binding protein